MLLIGFKKLTWYLLFVAYYFEKPMFTFRSYNIACILCTVLDPIHNVGIYIMWNICLTFSILCSTSQWTAGGFKCLVADCARSRQSPKYNPWALVSSWKGPNYLQNMLSYFFVRRICLSAIGKTACRSGSVIIQYYNLSTSTVNYKDESPDPGKVVPLL